MTPLISNQQRRVVNSLARRNLQGWGRPLEFTEGRLRLGIIFGGIGVLLFILHQFVATSNTFFQAVLAFAIIISLAFFVNFLLVHGVSYFRARSATAVPIRGTIDAAICNPHDYTPAARDDYYFITLRLSNGTLRAYALEAAEHADICAKKGQTVTLMVIPGIERVTAVK